MVETRASSARANSASSRSAANDSRPSETRGEREQRLGIQQGESALRQIPELASSIPYTTNQPGVPVLPDSTPVNPEVVEATSSGGCKERIGTLHSADGGPAQRKGGSVASAPRGNSPRGGAAASDGTHAAPLLGTLPDSCGPGTTDLVLGGKVGHSHGFLPLGTAEVLESPGSGVGLPKVTSAALDEQTT
jgi:hypothetical protein